MHKHRHIFKRGKIIIALVVLVSIACCAEPSGSPLAIGRPLPQFELLDLNGVPLSRHDHEGKILVINFWASWCDPCREEMPGLQRLSTELETDGIRVIGVNVDEDENLAREFIHQNGIRFPNFLDPEQSVTRDTLGIGAFPETLIVDQQGRIAQRVTGRRDWDEPSLRDRLIAVHGVPAISSYQLQ